MLRVENIKLLKNWERYTLLEMLDKGIILSHLDGNHGGLYPKKEEFVSEGIPYLSANCIEEDKINFSKTKFLTLERSATFKKGVAKNDDVLFAHNATVGPVAILKTELEYVILSTTLTYYRCNKDILLPKYLRLYMISDFFVNQYSEVMRQATRNQVPITKQRTFYHLIPPISDQHKIVATLDKAFAAIDTAKANTEQNLQNAKELFESYLQNVFENKGDDWEEKSLGEVCEFVQGIQRGVKLQSEICKEGQIRFLRIIDFTQGKQPPRYIDNPGDKYIMNNKDVSLVRYGASTGFVCQGKVGALANNLFRVKPKLEKELLNDFLFVFLSSAIFQNIIKASMNGAAMPAISFGLIKDIKFPIIPINKQNEIIKKLERLKAETKKLEAIYTQKIADLEEMKNSVLQKAFSGQLSSLN